MRSEPGSLDSATLMSILSREIRENLRLAPAWVWISIESVFLLIAIVGAAMVGHAAADYLATGAKPPWPPIQEQIVTENLRGRQLLAAGLVLATIASAVSIHAVRKQWLWLSLRLVLAPITIVAIVVVELPFLRLIFMDMMANLCQDCAPSQQDPSTVPAALGGAESLSTLVLIVFLVAWLVTVIVTIAMALRSRSPRRPDADPSPSR